MRTHVLAREIRRALAISGVALDHPVRIDAFLMILSAKCGRADLAEALQALPPKQKGQVYERIWGPPQDAPSIARHSPDSIYIERRAHPSQFLFSPLFMIALALLVGAILVFQGR